MLSMGPVCIQLIQNTFLWMILPMIELDFHEINELIEKHLGRQVVVIGAAIESDAHTVGIDAIFNAKGFAGNYGLNVFQHLVH